MVLGGLWFVLALPALEGIVPRCAPCMGIGSSASLPYPSPVSCQSPDGQHSIASPAGK